MATAIEAPSTALAPSDDLPAVASSASITPSTSRWSRASSPTSASAIGPLTLPTALQHPLAAEPIVAVSQLERFVLAGGRPAGHGRPAEGATFEPDVDLDGGIAARIQDLAAVDGFDERHSGADATGRPSTSWDFPVMRTFGLGHPHVDARSADLVEAHPRVEVLWPVVGVGEQEHQAGPRFLGLVDGSQHHVARDPLAAELVQGADALDLCDSAVQVQLARSCEPALDALGERSCRRRRRRSDSP